MKKTILITIFSVMVSTAFLTSCSSDDSIEDTTISETSTWVEPYHTMGSTMDQVKLYMENNMNSYYLKSSQANMLSYSKDKDACGFLYCFSPVTGELYSVIDTELISSKDVIHKKLKEHYDYVEDAQTGNIYYYNSNKSLVILVSDFDKNYCNVTYSVVTQ